MRSLYLHIPFCHKKCFYCSFVIAVGQDKRVEQYIDCMLSEASRYSGKEMSSVYFGGGTPSYFSGSQFETLIKGLHRVFSITDDAEITCEINPESIDRGKLKILRGLGINRISLGIQTFNDDYLKYLGRNHDSLAALRAYDDIRAAGFQNVSIDLMFSFPGQTIPQIQKDLDRVAAINPDHVSLYSLTIEENSRFYARQVILESDDVRAEQYSYVCHYLEKGGWPQYEVSNFAKPGFESRHNMNYWTGGEYLGLGIGAHSYLEGSRFWNTPKLTAYIKSIQEHRPVVEGRESQTSEQQMLDVVLFGLRMNQGISLAEAENRFSRKLPEDFYERTYDLAREGYLSQEGGILKATDKGRLVLDDICSRLL